jgi:SAM-dependent methyltransferase
MLYEYEGQMFPDYLKSGNACRFIAPIASEFCKGTGFDVGGGLWPLAGSVPVDVQMGGDAMALPCECQVDYVFSSHCLEHLPDPVGALLHWKSRIKPGGVLFLYLPHPDMTYWRPTRNRKHLHLWSPEQMRQTLIDLGLRDVMCSERDLAWSFACVGFVP